MILDLKWDHKGVANFSMILPLSTHARFMIDTCLHYKANAIIKKSVKVWVTE